MAVGWNELEAKQVLKELQSSEKGLSEQDVQTRLQKYGTNEIREEKKISRLEIFLNQFKSILVIILIGATVFSAAIGEILDAAAIIAIVILNAIFGFFQEYKAEKAIEALKRLSSQESVVIRDGRKATIPSKLLVPGDIIILEQGTKVPADIRLIEVTDLQIDESIITGESAPVTKKTEIFKNTVLAERKNMAWMGTVVTYGRGTGIVAETGMRTEMGRIAHTIQEAGEEGTPLQKKLAVFGKNLGLMIMVICGIVILTGVLRGKPIAEMIITGIALAVAAIPEGLPAVVTITLALGLQKLSKNNAIIRKLPAVEALGSTTFICADKTGTLTKNEMTVRKIWHNDTIVSVTGEGYKPEGKFLVCDKEITPSKDKTLELILRTAALCNNAEIATNGTEHKIVGDPTEGALLVAAQKAGLSCSEYPRTKETPFTSERKMMTTIHSTPQKKTIACVKGAPEKILSLCSHFYLNGKPKKLTPNDRKKILEANHKLTADALRVLAVAHKDVGQKEKDIEKGLTFLGLIGMIDPPRENVAGDIATCRKAGIKVVMITGDHLNTATAIAKEIRIIDSPEERAITGEELDKMSDQSLEEIVEQVRVYARVNPEHKVRIVDALKKKGHIIAMTGDGVNDAPALKKADIGVAMGINGTDVAKEASDMVLADDNFSSIVAAVKGGRQIYDNIKKFIQYLLSSNLGEVLIVFIAMLIGFTDPETGKIILPVTAIQLLWINLLTDGLPALALGADPPSKDVMDRPPRDPKENILSKGMFIDMSIVAVIMLIGTLGLFAYNLPSGGIKAMTVAFTTIVIFEMVRVQSVRAKYKVGMFSNKKLLLAIASTIVLQLFVIYTPMLQPAFDTVPLDLMDWIEIGLVASSVMIIMLIKDRIFRKMYD
ncbi:MAG: calcium-translocating P-type ATPase, SERCA-type [Candidatus Aenigmarchaeota archaeon]|nr:calcium-translocating P-type ATPase, SERCA-type [Candidatus Aenigmarchaeota archaeon]